MRVFWATLYLSLARWQGHWPAAWTAPTGPRFRQILQVFPREQLGGVSCRRKHSCTEHPRPCTVRLGHIPPRLKGCSSERPFPFGPAPAGLAFRSGALRCTISRHKISETAQSSDLRWDGRFDEFFVRVVAPKPSGLPGLIFGVSGRDPHQMHPQSLDFCPAFCVGFSFCGNWFLLGARATITSFTPSPLMKEVIDLLCHLREMPATS